MLKELRKLRAKGGKDRSKANYIASLQFRGVIKTYTSPKGYVAYETTEYEEYRKTARVGRPIKKEKLV